MSTEMDPDFPVVTGDYVMMKGWRVNLRGDFNRRIDEGSLVLWQPDLTFWIDVWNSEGLVSVDEVLQRLLADAGPDRIEERLVKNGAMVRLTYELPEDVGPSPKLINSFIIYPSGYMHLSTYYDGPDARSLAYTIIESVRAEA